MPSAMRVASVRPSSSASAKTRISGRTTLLPGRPVLVLRTLSGLTGLLNREVLFKRSASLIAVDQFSRLRRHPFGRTRNPVAGLRILVYAHLAEDLSGCRSLR